MGEEAGGKLGEVMNGIWLKGRNHSRVDFLKVLGNAPHMIRVVPLLNNIKELNIVKCSWRLVVLLYCSKVVGRRKPSDMGMNIMNSKKG